MEHATFTPLVMSDTGGIGRASTMFYKRLASMISEKRNTEYSRTVNWIRCKLSFALLRASMRGQGHQDIMQYLRAPRDQLTFN